MKKFLALAMFAVLLVCSFASCAQGGDTTEAMKDYGQEKNYIIDDAGNVFYFAEADGEAAILTKYTGKATTGDKVIVPEKFGDRTVTEIGDEAFYNLAAVVEVNIPATVTRIGKHAFAGCTELTAISLPAGTLSIGEAAFAGCTKLTTVNLTNANDAEDATPALEAIDKNAFRGCVALTTINGGKLPATLKTIGDAAFWGCIGLTSVEFPESVEKIGELAYYDCTGLESIKLHNNFAEGSLGKFIFTTAESTLKDKIDLSGITNEYVLQYVANIAEPASDETDGSSETETESESETETETETEEETETKPAEPDTYITKLTFDELRKNGDGAQGVFTPGQADAWDKTATVDKTVMTLDFWGWVGLKGEIGQFGYQIGNGGIVYDDSFTVEAEGPVQDAAAGSGADTASRMLIKIDISKISGTSTVKTYYKSATGKAEVLAEFTVLREAPALTAPVGDAQPVHIIQGEALYPPAGANDIATHTPYEGYVNIVPSGDDPYYLIPAGFTGARYVAIKYCTSTADKCNTQIYLGSTGEGPSNDNTMLQTPIVGDGNWNIVVFDLNELKEPLNSEYYVSYFRFDALQAGFQTDENGNYIYINEEKGNIAKLPMPADADLDVAYIAFFNTKADAYAYEYGADVVPDIKYVTDGLVSLYQGGTGNVWEDVVGSNDVTLTLDANNTLTESGLQVKTAQHYFPQAIVDLVNGQTFTVEILFGDFECLGTSFNTFMNSSNDNFALFRRVSTDELEFKFAGNGGTERHKIPGAQALLPNSLITVTYTVGGDCVIYINGEKAAVKSSPKVMGATDLYIGHLNADKDFNALYRSIRFYNVALTADQVLANAIVDGVAQPAGPATPVEPAEMSKADIFELGIKDGKPVDISSNAMPITVLGAPVINGENHVFAGKPDNYKVPAFKDHYANLQDGFTLEVYLTTGADVTTKQAPVANLHAGGFGMEITDGLAALLVRFGSSYLTVDAPVEANTTYHMVAVYDNAAGQLRMYVNGALTDTQKVSGTMELPSADGAKYLCIGADSEIDYGSTGENFFTGTIHDVRIYGNAATDGNALWLWQQIGA